MDSVSRQLLMSGGGLAPPAVAPISIWTMDGVSGNNVPDSQSLQAGTKTSGASVVTGRIGNAIRHANSGLDYISMGRATRTSYDTTNNSVAMWVKFNTLNDGYLFDNNNRQGGSGSPYNNGWYMRVTAGGSLRAFNTLLNNESWSDGGTGGGTGTDYTPRVSTPAGALSTGVWNHIVAVSQDKSITLYLNSVKIGTTTHTQSKRIGNGDASINGLYVLGNYIYDNNQVLTGVLADIDESRHYNYALTDSNVAWLYANT